MSKASSKQDVGRRLALSAFGVALVAPIPILAGEPELIPAWLLEKAGGVPLLSWAIVLLLAALVGVALLCATIVGLSDD